MFFLDIYLKFGNTSYVAYEHDSEVCVTVEHDKPALSATSIEITVVRGSATSKLYNYCVHIFMWKIHCIYMLTCMS